MKKEEIEKRTITNNNKSKHTHTHTHRSAPHRVLGRANVDQVEDSTLLLRPRCQDEIVVARDLQNMGDFLMGARGEAEDAAFHRELVDIAVADDDV